MIYIGTNLTISDFFFEGKEIICYPYMTATCPYVIKLERNEYWKLEDFLCQKANKKYDVFGTEELIPVNGVKHDNKQTFVVGGMCFQFWDFNLYIGSASEMKVGRFF